jgi:hypothetical protein
MLKQIKNNYIVTLVILTSIVVLSLHSLILLPYSLAYTNEISEKKFLSPIFEVSTRTNDINITQLVNSTYNKFGSGCPNEIAVYVHGFNKTNSDAKEEFNRIQTSLIYNNYRIPIVGFSWDSNVNWTIAKNNARDNGLYLAQFIMEFKNKCPSTNIHLIAHSLGASVIDSALVILDINTNWNAKIATVHLLGAAINNQLISNNTLLGNATENVVNKFYNLFDPEDEGLKVNEQVEKYQPLGLVGAPKGAFHLNYKDIDVSYEIPPISDADGDSNSKECFENIQPSHLWGNNHCGYIGFRNSTSDALIDDGVMNIVVRNLVK